MRTTGYCWECEIEFDVRCGVAKQEPAFCPFCAGALDSNNDFSSEEDADNLDEIIGSLSVDDEDY